MTVVARPATERASLFVSVADACLVGCRFCLRADRGGNVLLLRTYARALSRLGELGLHELCLTGGEPTDHEQFRDLVRVATQFGWSCSVVTAARPGPRAERLLSVSSLLTHITVSADSAQAVALGRTTRSVPSLVPLLDQLPARRTTVHLVCWQLGEFEVQELARLVATTGVHLVVSPLLPTRNFRPAPTVEACQAQWHSDITLLAKHLDLSDALQRNFREYTTELEGSLSRSCQTQTLYLSASGELRRCPYAKNDPVSVWGSRDEIRSGVRAFFRDPPSVRVECMQICRP